MADDLANKLDPKGSWLVSRVGEDQYYLTLKALPSPVSEQIPE